MDCRSYATAEKYQIWGMEDSFKKRYPDVLVIKNVLHVSLETKKRAEKEVFLFPYGVICFWNTTLEEEQKILQELTIFSENPSIRIGKDEFTYEIQIKNTTKESFLKIIHQDHILLPDGDPLIKMSFSHAIAQSLRLSILENTSQSMLQDTQYIPENLKKTGKIQLSRRKIAKIRGKLFLERSSIHMHSDILGIPDFFWEYPEYEQYYLAMYKYLDIQKRMDILHTKLLTIHELLEMLADEQNHSHSSFLEWIIILLIAIEIVFTLFEKFHLW